ncbi:MAG: DUF1800 domain-containing protein [Planctomycetes bacterium]|nr:DUF1800 domain-containing protein [Planctomycetota bacterium]
MTSVEGAPPVAAGEGAVPRRSLLGLGLGSALAIAAQRSAAAQSTAPHVQPRGSSEIGFLLSRITNGFDPVLFARAHALGYAAFLEEQLHPETIIDVRGDLIVAQFTTITATTHANYVGHYLQGRAELLRNELRTSTILRAAYSSRQLHERMVEFWTDHFNIDHNDSMNAALKTTDDREVIRKHALGNFSQLLGASARSASMGFYLGNYRNIAGSPNENYGREIMELHTLGVGNYTEADVKAVARCFTGWGFKEVTSGDFGAFLFRPQYHDNNPKVVLGHSLPAGGGLLDGEFVVRLLAQHPVTADHLALKLCRFFLSYDPPAEVVRRVAQAYMETNGDIKSMLRVVFALSSIALVPQATRPKYKRPFHLLTSILRPLKFQMTAPEQLSEALGKLGHQPFRWPTPNGYPDKLDLWASGEQARWAFASDLFGNAIPGISFDPATVFAGVPQSEIASTANLRLTGGALSPSDLAALQTFVSAYPAVTDALLRDVMVLTVSSPSFQLY